MNKCQLIAFLHGNENEYFQTGSLGQDDVGQNDVIRCPACEEEYCDPPTEEWIQCCKCQEWWHEECSNYENGIFICDYC